MAHAGVNSGLHEDLSKSFFVQNHNFYGEEPLVCEVECSVDGTVASHADLVKDSVVCGALELIVVDGEGGRIRWVEDVGFPRHGRVAPGGALLPNWLVQIQAQTLEKRRGEIGRRECTFTFHCDSVVVMSFEKYFLKSGTKEIAKKRLRMERISNVGKLIT